MRQFKTLAAICVLLVVPVLFPMSAFSQQENAPRSYDHFWGSPDERRQGFFNGYDLELPDVIMDLLLSDDFVFFEIELRNTSHFIFSEFSPCDEWGCTNMLVRRDGNRLFAPVVFVTDGRFDPLDIRRNFIELGTELCVSGSSVSVC